MLLKSVQTVAGETVDMRINNGIITDVFSQPTTAQVGEETFNAEGLTALPGFVDLHTHLREPGREDAETIATGSAAAAAGGFTAVFAMANTTPVTDTGEAARLIKQIGQEVGLVDVYPIGAITKNLGGKELAELGMMNSAAGVKIFSDDGKCVQNARVMRRALEYLKPFNGIISQHSQDADLADGQACCHESELSGRLGLPGWPDVAEEVIAARDIMLARHTGSRVHIAHVSSVGTVELLRWAKSQDIAVTAEATPHHLYLTHNLLSDYDPVYKVNPPLRPLADVQVIREALADGTIDIVATDHAPHAAHDKQHAFVDAAFGMIGLEQAFSVINTVMVQSGLMDLEDLVRVMSIRPAQIAGLSTHGQNLVPGAPANITLVDPEADITVDATSSLSRSRNNPYHDHKLKGRVHATLLRGKFTFQEGISA